MSQITIYLEIGHNASIREKITQEGFTHDWEVFVRGLDGADLRHYVDRVVFHLHKTFEKPKRVVKEPPYSIRTSGYASFTLPIQVYLKNSHEPRKIEFNYDLLLQPSGPPIHHVQKEKYTFHMVNEEFRSKLLKGGAVLGSVGTSENASLAQLGGGNKPSAEEPRSQQMTSKPKLSGSGEQPKKYKLKPEEPKSDQFTNLFGTPITKTSRVIEVPKNKESAGAAAASNKPVSSKSNAEKDRGDKFSDKGKNRLKLAYKEKERGEKDKSKDKSTTENLNATSSSANDKKLREDKKDKRDKNKERDYNNKKDKKERKEREKSPTIASRPKSASPKRVPKRIRSPSPSVNNKTNINKEKEAPKEKDSRDRDRDKEKKAKKHKEKEIRQRDKSIEHSSKDYNKNKDTKDKSGSFKEKENNTASTKPPKEVSSPNPAINVPIIDKAERKDKLKDNKEIREQQEKIIIEQKDNNKFVEENKPNKHKHKKKDKDRKEKNKERGEAAEKSHKNKEVKKLEREKGSLGNISKDRGDKTDNLFGCSPKSEPSSCPSPPIPAEIEHEKSTTGGLLLDDESSNSASKISSREPSASLSRSPTPLRAQETLNKKFPTPEELNTKKLRDPSGGGGGGGTPTSKKKDKKERKKEKKIEKEHEKKRKRKVEAETQVEEVEEEPPSKAIKKDQEDFNNSDDERKVSSTEDAKLLPNPHDSEAYMNILRDLQTKIMSLKENSDLQKVVQLIAETGLYEVSANTFDFDLCLLDRSTVMQLQAFISSIN